METEETAYYVTQRCGHRTPIKYHNVRYEWMLRRSLCNDCKHKAEAKLAATFTCDLPALVGTPKQVQWATTLRATLYLQSKQSELSPYSVFKQEK